MSPPAEVRILNQKVSPVSVIPSASSVLVIVAIPEYIVLALPTIVI